MLEIYSSVAIVFYYMSISMRLPICLSKPKSEIPDSRKMIACYAVPLNASTKPQINRTIHIIVTQSYPIAKGQIPRLKTTIPSSPPLSQNSFSNVCALTDCLCGNAPRANGKATKLVVKISPRFVGRTKRGFRFSHSIFCNCTSATAGMTITGELFKTRLKAVSLTARVAAFLLFPRLGTSDSDLLSAAKRALSTSESTG